LIASALDASEEQKKAVQNRTVLICDDNEDILFVTSTALKRRYDVLTAKSGNDCIKLFNEANSGEKRIDIVLLDFKLGDMTGDNVARTIREMTPLGLVTKVVLITAFELDEGEVSKMKEERLIDVMLKKPFSLSDLQKTISETVSA
jgi:response regulator RpfG family c-di-GMP phosphodiesterase